MANPKCNCCGHEESEVKVQLLTLEDGRRAERHAFVDTTGNEVVEILAEEKRPLKLERRIVKEHKQVVAKETRQTIQDGNVVAEEVVAGEAVEYVRKDEIGKLVADAVLAGMQALMTSEHEPVPSLGAQAIVEKNVAEKQAGNTTMLYVLGAVLVAQIGFFLYMFF